MMPVQHVDFNFDSACSTPYITAPSSPQRFGTSLISSSAPTSPTRASFFYRHFNEHEEGIKGNSGRPGSEIPFGWEEKPGIPKSSVDNADGNDDGDFAFDFSGQLEKNSLSAEELFDGGKIKPLKPPPRLQFVGGCGSDENEKVGCVPSPRSPRSPRSAFAHGKKMFREAISSSSPREKYSDPFTAAIEAARKESVENELQGGRGRRRVVSGSSSSSIRKGRTRSLSPLRVSDITFVPEEDNSPCATTTPKTNTVASFLNSFSFSKGYKKWKLKDFLLFRSASEGRATDLKHPLNKYAALSSKAEDVKNSSFRSTDSSGSVSSLRRKGPVSAHELHYTANRAVSEEMRRKTFLPYNKGLLGCLGFNPAVRELSRGFGSLSRE